MAFDPAGAVATATSDVGQLKDLVTIIGGALAALATMIGLPAVLLLYRKTRAEIVKLELEAAALRAKQPAYAERSQDEEGNVKIWVDRSTDTTIQVLADPRLLAPLLVLLDFIFAWVVLTLAGHLLGLMGLGILRSLTLGILAFALLVPIARQVLRVRAVLRPPRSPEETRTSRKRARAIGYLAYGSLAVVLLLLGIAFFTAEGLTTLGRYLAWWLVVSGFLLIISTPFAKIIFDRYLESIYQVDGG